VAWISQLRTSSIIVGLPVNLYPQGVILHD